MKKKIFKEVYRGSGPIHLLSVVEKENTNEDQIFNSRKSKILSTDNWLLESFYKSPL